MARILPRFIYYVITGLLEIAVGIALVALCPLAFIGLLWLEPKWYVAVPALIPIVVLGRVAVGPTGIETIVEGRARLRMVRPIDFERIILYLRSFREDLQSADALYGPGALRIGDRSHDSDEKALRDAGRIVHGMFLADDAAEAISLLWGTTYEQQIAFATARAGSLVGFSRRGIVRLGARSLRIPDAQWKTGVCAYMKMARLILAKAGDTPGLRWELRQLKRMTQPEKVLILFPRDSFGNHETNMTTVLPIIETELEIVIPPPSEDSVLLEFTDDWAAWFTEGRNLQSALGDALGRRGLPTRRRPQLGPRLLLIGRVVGILWFAWIFYFIATDIIKRFI